MPRIIRGNMVSAGRGGGAVRPLGLPRRWRRGLLPSFRTGCHRWRGGERGPPCGEGGAKRLRRDVGRRGALFNHLQVARRGSVLPSPGLMREDKRFICWIPMTTSGATPSLQRDYVVHRRKGGGGWVGEVYRKELFDLFHTVPNKLLPFFLRNRSSGRRATPAHVVLFFFFLFL